MVVAENRRREKQITVWHTHKMVGHPPNLAPSDVDGLAFFDAAVQPYSSRSQEHVWHCAQFQQQFVCVSPQSNNAAEIDFGANNLLPSIMVFIRHRLCQHHVVEHLPV